MPGALSFPQEQALISLHRHWPFGIDSRTARGLELRGLVTLVRVGAGFKVPALTLAGAIIAADLDRAEKTKHCRQVRGMWVLDGGPEARLDEFDHDEWREVVRELRPDLDDDAFEHAWAGFLEIKRRREQQ